MVTIVEAGEEEKKAWCRRHGLPEDSRALSAVCGGKAAGYVLYALGEGRVTLLWAEADDRVLQEALVRAAMNAGYNAGAAEAVGVQPPEELRTLLETLRFAREEDGTWRVSLAEFFSRSCRGQAGG